MSGVVEVRARYKYKDYACDGIAGGTGLITFLFSSDFGLFNFGSMHRRD